MTRLDNKAEQPVVSMHARGDSMVEKENSVVIQLGVTPRYLDPRCHEALYEVDMGVNEVCDLLNGRCRT